ncbi:MAG: C40 family peptidase, partial [Campylobacteraceae bacterium]|nr:C40 family peptidase [Campylobacteraceae bacterium]
AYYEEGLFAHYLKVGTILPISGYQNKQYKAFIITTGKDAKGVATNVTISEEFAKPFPLELNAPHAKQIIDELLDENYGWGGLYANRDCSAFTKDFFSVFGIWLPRNSLAQKNTALYFDVSNLTAAQKEQKLKELGQPYLTLIYLPGHIMLYVGEIDNRAVVAHNIWGIKTKDNGRYIIGKSIISDLYLGENVSKIDKRSLLINKMQGFTVLTLKKAEDESVSEY